MMARGGRGPLDPAGGDESFRLSAPADDGFERDRCSCSICAAAGPKTLISGRELTGAWGAGRAWPDDWRPDLGARSGLASGAGLAVCFVPLA
jgi:hypothetical protein